MEAIKQQKVSMFWQKQQTLDWKLAKSKVYPCYNLIHREGIQEIDDRQIKKTHGRGNRNISRHMC